MLVCYTFRRNQVGLACVCALQVISEDKHTHTLPMSCTFFLSWKQRGKEEGYVCTQASVYSCTITQLVPHVSFTITHILYILCHNYCRLKFKRPPSLLQNVSYIFTLEPPSPPPPKEKKNSFFFSSPFLSHTVVYAHHFCDLALHN